MMNEQIKQLAKQAGGEFYEGFAGSPNSVKFTEDEFQKFVERIVRVCAGVTEEYRGTACGKAAECIGDSIKQHFGVE